MTNDSTMSTNNNRGSTSLDDKLYGENGISATNLRSHDLNVGHVNLSRKKIVYLVRHAESEENVDMQSLFDAARDVRNFQLPQKQDAKRGLKFLGACVAGNTDAPLSDFGKYQSQTMGEILHSDRFLEAQQIQLIAHSPLIRARDTCQSMLLNFANTQRVEQLECLREATPYEQVVTLQHSLRTRILEFQHWLAAQKEDRIAVVGHSQYFKLMLGMDEKFRNCDVWAAEFICDNILASTSSICAVNLTTSNNWKDVKLIYRFSQEKKE